MLRSPENSKRAPSYKTVSFWWLELGREHCFACGQTYVYETGYYCAGCDGGLCSICVEETISTDIFCIQCKASERIVINGGSGDLEG